MVKSLLFCLLLACTGGLLLAQAKAIPAEYIFKTGVTYEMKASTNAKANEMTSWFSTSSYTGMGMGEQGIMMVYDMGSKQIVTFMEQQKMYMTMDMEKMKQKAADLAKQYEDKKPASDYKVAKTGKSEAVAGYPCEQWQVTSSDNKTLVWITTALGVNYSNMADGLMMLMKSGSGTGSIPDMKGMTNGVMLKMESTDLKNNNVVTMVAKSVNKAGMTIKTAGYKGMVMPGQ